SPSGQDHKPGFRDSTKPGAAHCSTTTAPGCGHTEVLFLRASTISGGWGEPCVTGLAGVFQSRSLSAWCLWLSGTAVHRPRVPGRSGTGTTHDVRHRSSRARRDGRLAELAGLLV